MIVSGKADAGGMSRTQEGIFHQADAATDIARDGLLIVV